MNIPDDYEIRKDGKCVRKDRWEWGIRRIAALLWGNRCEFEIDDVVAAVKLIVAAPNEEAEAICEGIQKMGRSGYVFTEQSNASLVPPGFKVLKDTTLVERSWPEDESHENGDYFNNCALCLRTFMGHKRRVVCRACSLART